MMSVVHELMTSAPADVGPTTAVLMNPFRVPVVLIIRAGDEPISLTENEINHVATSGDRSLGLSFQMINGRNVYFGVGTTAGVAVITSDGFFMSSDNELFRLSHLDIDEIFSGRVEIEMYQAPPTTNNQCAFLKKTNRLLCAYYGNVCRALNLCPTHLSCNHGSDFSKGDLFTICDHADHISGTSFTMDDGEVVRVDIKLIGSNVPQVVNQINNRLELRASKTVFVAPRTSTVVVDLTNEITMPSFVVGQITLEERLSRCGK